MKFVLCLVALIAVAAFAAPLNNKEASYVFSKWMKEHGKQYQDAAEFDTRLSAFKANVERVRQHQANANRTWDMALNKYADLTPAEFAEQMMSYIPRDNAFLRSKNEVYLPTRGLPASLDWVAQGKVTEVKDQGQCGSCWSFSTTGSVEAAYAIEQNPPSLVELSEQELVDCSGSAGNEGCSGGLMDNAFNWIISNGGLCSEQAYPYHAVDQTCVESTCQSVLTITAYTDVPPNSETQLQAACAQQPIAIAVDASAGWQMYNGGIIDPSCGCSTNLDHGVLLVGWGTDNGVDYWKVKNSWGKSWGEAGYIRLKRGTGGSGTCGLCMDPSYPTGVHTV